MSHFESCIHCVWCDWQSERFAPFGRIPTAVIQAMLGHVASEHALEHELQLLEHGIEP